MSPTEPRSDTEHRMAGAWPLTSERLAWLEERVSAPQWQGANRWEVTALLDALSAALAAKEAAEAETELLRETLARWESGQRRKSWPVIAECPDGLRYAAELVRAQGTEGGDQHDALLRAASSRLHRLTEISGSLLARVERVDALCARAEANRDAQPFAHEIPAVLTSDEVRAALGDTK